MARRPMPPDDDFDLGEFARQQLQRFQGPVVLAAAVILLVVIGVLTSVYTVEPEGRAVVKRLGKFIAIAEPGLRFKLPFGIDTATFVPTERVLKQEFGFRTIEAAQRSTFRKGPDALAESLMLTGDLNVIDVEWVVQYRISDAERYLHAVRDPEATIRDVSEAVMRRIVGNRLGSDVLTIGRVEVAAQALSELKEAMAVYDMGVSIGTVELQTVSPPEPVKPAFNEVNQAQQEKERLINEAERLRNQLLPRARGEAQQMVAQARGYAAERVNAAEGETARFTAILEQYNQAKDVTRRRLYLEMIDRVMPRIGRLYVIDGEQVAPLPLLDLTTGAAAARTRQGGDR